MANIGETTALIPQAGSSNKPEHLQDGGSGDTDFPYGKFKALATVGEIDPENGHVLTGYPDGQAAWLLDEDTVRVVYQSESYATMSNETYPWEMDSGVTFTGSHVHTIDYNRSAFADFLNNDSPASGMFEGAGHLFNTIYNVFGEIVDGKNADPTDLSAKWGNQVLADGTLLEFREGQQLTLGDFFFHSFCGAYYEQANKYGDGIGFVDDVWLMAEEWNIGSGMYADPDGDGPLTADDFFTETMGLASIVVDIANETAYTVPVLGQSGYEKILPINSQHEDYVVLVMSGYNLEVEPAPLRIYIGKKDMDASGNPIDYDTASDRDAFLARNGLLFGQLYGMAATDETYATLGITEVDADTEMLNEYATNGDAPDNFSVKYFPTSYQWDGFDTPENANETEVFRWLHDGDDGEPNEQPDGYTYFNGDSKVEHPAVDPNINNSRYVINLTDASTTLGIDFTNIFNDLENDLDGNGLPDYLSADVTRIVAGVDGALTLKTGGKGAAHIGSNNPDATATHAIHVEKGKARMDQPDGLQWVKTADGDYLIVDEDSGNDYGERKYVLPINGETLQLVEENTGYFLASAGGSLNPRAQAGVAAIPETFSRATSSEFSGTWNVTHLVAKKEDGSFYTQEEIAGTGAQEIIGSLPLEKQVLIGVLQHSGESGGIIADRQADQGGQIFQFKIELPVLPELVGYAELPADTFAEGQPSGSALTNPTNGRETPFASQPVQGFSGVQFADQNSYWFLSDNGFGSKANSADYLLRIYKVDPDFVGSEDGNGSVEVESFIQLSDPNNLVPFDIVKEGTSDRLLTGADFDIESFVIAEDGSIWVGDEFGPFLLHFDSEGVLLNGVETPNITNFNTLNGQDPLVIAHRGASGYLPEHTLEAYQMAIEMGADFIEPDLVTTADGVLIARHEPILDGTTNVAEVFGEDRKSTKMLDGVETTAYFAEDFTLAEIKTLKAKQALSFRDQSFNGLYEIPTFAEVIDLVKQVEAETGKQIGIYPETKHPTFFDVQGLSLEEKVIETLIDKEFTDPSRIFIQSFEVQNLIDLQGLLDAEGIGDIPLVQLYGDTTVNADPTDPFSAPYDIRYNVAEGNDLEAIYGDLTAIVDLSANTVYGDLDSPEVLQWMSDNYAEGAGPWKNNILLRNPISPPVDGNGDGTAQITTQLTGEITSFVEDAHDAGLQVHPYTMRNEERYLTLNPNGTPQTPQQEYEQLIRIGFDGFFTDFTDTAVAVVEQVTAEYVQSPDNPFLASPADANLGGSGGFEGMGFSPDRSTLYPLLEKTVKGDPEGSLRIYEFDIASQTFADELAGLYQMEAPNHAIGDMTPINDNEFLIIERDGGQGETAMFKKIFKVDLSNLDENGFVEKTEVVDLLNIADPNDLNGDGKTTFDFPFVTIEDVLVIDAETILVANDNNYPFSIGRGPDIDNNEIIQLKLATPLDLDDRLGVANAPNEKVTTPADNTATPMVTPMVEGVSFQTLITIGEAATQSETDAANGSAYIPVGIPDGQGVIDLGDGIVRLFTNSEVGRDRGYAYTLANGLELTGARINYVDIDTATNTVINGGLAYDTIIDRKGVEVTDAQQINWLPDSSNIAETAGFDRFCSANLVHADTFGDGRGFEDDIFLLGEETSPDFPPTVRDGTFQALDIANETIYAVPDLGYGSWESGTLLDTGREDMVAVVLGDDYTDAPIWLYVGEKDTSAGAGFLERNGLVDGQLYTWVANDGSETPADLFGTGTKMGGTWVEIEVQDPSMAGMPGYDDEGYLLGETLRGEARSAGAFFFSRPEDVDVNPFDGTEFTVANTGDGGGETNPTDLFGDINIFDVDFDRQGNPISAELTILYDGDTPELNGVDSSFKGIRNPDNLAWSADGYIYIQEDFAYDFAPEDAEGLEEASIWRVAPNGNATRIAEIDRSVVLPEGTTDSRAENFGAWESSGIIDVSEYYGNPAGTDFYLTVQAHGIRDGIIADLNLVEGGQILHLKSELEPFEPEPELPKTVFGSPDADYFDSAFMDEKMFGGKEQNLFTGSGDDTVDVSVMGQGNRIDTGSGDDMVFAGTNNRIILGAGDDILFAGSGEGGNNITGGMGADQFWLITDIDAIPPMNKISDFKGSQGDVIGFANTDLSLGNKGSDWNYQQQGSNVIISVDGQEIAQLLNTTITDANFVFA